MRKFNLRGDVAKVLKGLPLDKAPGKDETSCSEEHAKKTAGTASEILYAWRTDKGRLRRNNQDAVIIGNGLLGVADGMGGHNGGEIASAALKDGLLRETDGAEPDGVTLVKAIEKINLELYLQQENDPSLSGMGTTLTVLWPDGDEMLVAQVGDSRAYLIRDGEIKQVTNDHSMVADMVRRGVLTEDQAACHPMRNYITRAVGTETTIETDLIRIRRQNRDRWLICSDGLYGMLQKKVLLELSLKENLEEAADMLLTAAMENGGRDNISLILADDQRDTPAAPAEQMMADENAPDSEDAVSITDPDGEGNA